MNSIIKIQSSTVFPIVDLITEQLYQTKSLEELRLILLKTTFLRKQCSNCKKVEDLFGLVTDTFWSQVKNSLKEAECFYQYMDLHIIVSSIPRERDTNEHKEIRKNITSKAFHSKKIADEKPLVNKFFIKEIKSGFEYEICIQTGPCSQIVAAHFKIDFNQKDEILLETEKATA